MKNNWILAIGGVFILLGVYLFYQYQNATKRTTECIVQADRTVINIYAGKNLTRSTGFSVSEILDWYKGRSKPIRINRSQPRKEYKSINPKEGMFTYIQNQPDFYYSELISKQCYEKIP